MKTIAIYSMKGGVGKTATAVNLAYCAAKDGKFTLICDLDPQAASTFYLRVKPERGGVRRMLSGKVELDRLIKASDFERLDLLPARFSFRKADLALADKDAPARRQAVEDKGVQFAMHMKHVQAMQLWNDWNTQVHEWATRHGTSRGEQSKQGDVEYLWMRSEDLLPGSPKRLECLHALAEFVGSTLTPNQLCTLSLQEARDYGKSVDVKELPQVSPQHTVADIGERWRKMKEAKAWSFMPGELLFGRKRGQALWRAKCRPRASSTAS